MQHYFAVGGEKLGDQGRQTDPEIDIGAVGEILRGPPGDLTTFERHRDFLYAKPSIQTVEMGYPVLSVRERGLQRHCDATQVSPDPQAADADQCRSNVGAGDDGM